MIIEEQTHSHTRSTNRTLIQKRLAFICVLILTFSLVFWISKPTPSPTIQTTIQGTNDLYYLTIKQGAFTLMLETDNALFLEPLQSLMPKIIDVLNTQPATAGKDEMIFALNRFLYPYYITDILTNGGAQ